jgi:O-antigen/teichoic acid export membrane protein
VTTESIRTLFAGSVTRSLLDIAAVFSGRLGGVILNLLFLPAYDDLLGPKIFGAVAIILSFVSFFMVFDFGAATIVATDIAASVEGSAARDKVGQDWRRSEYIIIGVVSVGLVASLVLVAAHQLQPFGVTDLILAAFLISAMILLNVGQAALNGLQAYRLNNGLILVGSVARGLTTILVLRYVEASLMAFLTAQVVASALHYAALRRIVSSRLIIKQGGLLERDAMLRLWRRMRPLVAYTLAGALVMQVDKPVVAGFFSLEMAGRWFLATTYAPIAVLAGPLNQYFYPKMVAARADPVDVLVVGRRFQVAVSLAVTAPSVVLVYFAPELLALWLPHTGDIGVIAPIAQLLLMATAFGATGYLPTAWLLASGDRIWLARLAIAATTLVIGLLMLAGLRQDIMAVAAVYAAYHSIICLLLWFRMLSSWPWRKTSMDLVLACWLGPVLAVGICTALVSGVAGGFPVAGWMQVLVASMAGALATLVVAGLWWFCYPPMRNRS